jgi:hypothetical protein
VRSLAAIVSFVTASPPFVWIVVVLALAGGVLALMVVLTRRPVDVGELGCVTDRWIAAHRVEVP